MEKRRILLHIGPHKTGTTAIQSALAKNKEALAEIGWAYATLPEIPGGTHQFADWLSFGKFEDLNSSVEKLNGIDGNIILSSENFSRAGKEAIAWLRQAMGEFGPARIDSRLKAV